MSTTIKVDTGAVTTAAINIRKINNTIQNDFATVETAVSKMDSSWDGAAATKAISSFNDTKLKFFEARYTVIDNYATLLSTQVGSGYVATETKNYNLADEFK